MRFLLLGATGATGRLLAHQLLERGCSVRAVVRSPDRLPEPVRAHAGLEAVTGSVLSMTDAQLDELTAGCEGAASCLGHRLSLRGVFGPPRRLVTDSIRRVAAALERRPTGAPARLLLMSSAGVRNHDLQEPVSAAQRTVLAVLRTLVPPHADNEQAAEFLRTTVGPSQDSLEWAVVRPDTLIDAPEVSPYALHASPTRSAIFDPGKTSRANVAHTMAELLTNAPVWAEWRGRMPVVYNRE